MRIRAIDYAANLGGGVRFVVELTRALVAHPDVSVEVVSFGRGADSYRRAFADIPGISVASIAPTNERATRSPLLGHMHYLGAIRRALGIGSCFHFQVPAAALSDADVYWFPWLHRHRVPSTARVPLFGSLHDTITVDYPQHAGKHPAQSEGRTLRLWLASPASVAVSSHATRDALQRLFSCAKERILVIPLSASHRAAGLPAKPDPSWAWLSDRFLICPAGIAPHKNHETLLRGVSLWGKRAPLVLTGQGTDLCGINRRAPELRWLASRCGFKLGESLVPLGYLDDPEYFAILRNAWALVMPTLAEGGGSFPVWEALTVGTPVVCSDIPVMREMMTRAGGEVLWFDPRDPSDLARRLTELEADYASWKERAVRNAALLHFRSWSDVALDYLREFARLAGPTGDAQTAAPFAASASVEAARPTRR